MHVPDPQPTTFAELGLPDSLVHTVTTLGYEEPTPIQAATIPHLLTGADLLGQAATGTGKTAAFALPLLARLSEGEPQGVPRALVLAPTRELAVQVAEALHRYGRSLGVRVLAVYGGQPIGRQIRALSQGVDVVVATPGRAVDHLQRQTLSLDAVRILVIDEADEMLDMGFADELEVVLSAIGEPPVDEGPPSARRQTVLFSATLPRHIKRLAQQHLHDPVSVSIAREPVAQGETPQIQQTAYLVRHADKRAALGRILDFEAPAATLVFCRTRIDVDELTDGLASRGYRAEALHGGMSQEQRDKVIHRLKRGIAELVVATDVAARGLDVDTLTHVVNFDVPSSPASYVHRIGRVGRAGRQGVALTLADPREHRLLQNIERLIRQPFTFAPVPTAADLDASRLERTRQAVHQLLEDADHDLYRPIVEALTQGADPVDVALAAVRLAHEARNVQADLDTRDFPLLHPPGSRKDRPRPDRGRDPRSSHRGPPMARLFIGVGRQLGVRPQDLFGAIINEAGIDRREVGDIQIRDRFSLVEVSEDVAELVLDALRQTKIKGRRPTIRFDRQEAGGPPRHRFPRGKRR